MEIFKMLVELVLRGPDDDGDFEVRSSPQSAFLVSGFETDLSQQGCRTLHAARVRGQRGHRCPSMTAS